MSVDKSILGGMPKVRADLRKQIIAGVHPETPSQDIDIVVDLAFHGLDKMVSAGYAAARTAPDPGLVILACSLVFQLAETEMRMRAEAAREMMKSLGQTMEARVEVGGGE